MSLDDQCPAPDHRPDQQGDVLQQGELAWGTESLDASTLYLHDDHAEKLVVEAGRGPLWLFGHGGLGINSHAWSQNIRSGPLILALQSLWAAGLIQT